MEELQNNNIFTSFFMVVFRIVLTFAEVKKTGNWNN